MAPDVDYTLTEDAYNRYESLLAEQGVTACPLRSETERILDGGATTMHVYGALRQGTLEFPYTITRTPKGNHILNVEVFGNGRNAGDNIMAALGRAFPQPERGFLHQPQPERRVEPGTFLQNNGCLFAILFLVVVFVFAVIGVISIFK